VLGRFEDHRGPAVTVAFSPDGRTALPASHGNLIRLLKLPEPDNDATTPARKVRGGRGTPPAGSSGRSASLAS
jgi:hypothetical protein